MDDFAQLRKKFDGSDQFMTGHLAGGVPGTTHEKRVANTPNWLYSDIKVREMIAKIFPKWQESEKQKVSAVRWMGVIHHYFRRGLTSSATAQALGISHDFVRKTVERIKKARTGRARGRPKKIASHSQNTSEETGIAITPLDK